MTEIAALQLQADSDQIKQTTAALREMAPAATAAEKAAERWGMTTKEAGRSTEDFSRRVQNTIKQLEFERAQLTRTAAEQAKYSALRRAGVSAASAEGQAIAASVAALQAQRAAVKGAGEATTVTGKATAAAASAASGLVTHLKYLALAYISVEGARKLWEIGMKAGDLGEQAEQIGVNTEQLQAYRFAAAQAGIDSETLGGALTKLQKAMGTAADGNKDMIERFQQLGVKLLDAKGQLRPVADVLPEVAKSVLEIGSTSQRTATLMELFGKSGAKMATVLEEIAKGNDAAIISAQKAGAILDKDIIEAWDNVSDAMVRAGLAADVTIAKLGAPIATASLNAIEALLNRINGVMDQINSKEGFWKSILNESRSTGRMGGLRLETPEETAARRAAELQAELKNPANAGREAMIQADIDRMRQAQSQQQFGAQGALQAGGAPSSSVSRFLPRPAPSVGVGSPAVKGAGDAAAKAYQKIIDSAKDYIATKNAETAAIGLGVEAAARLKHETELTAKATNDNTVLTAAQTAQIKALAGAMAEADTKFASAKFMDDAVTKSNEFIAAQKIEQDTLWMSAEAADAYRIAQGYLNDAKSKGIELTAAEKAQLQDLAVAQAAAAQKTREAKDLYDLAKASFTGFVTDLRQGLMDGKTVWEAFGNAGKNALDKIAGALIDMAAKKLFESAFGGAAGGGGGGLFGGILGGGGAGSTSGGLLDFIFTGLMGSPFGLANGGVLNRGNVIPFARGGIVSRPTLFPMANGMGLMGEAGPEAVMPLRRGPGGRLGVSMPGGGGQQQPVIVHVTGDTDLVRVHAEGAAVKVYNQREPSTVGKSVKQATRLAPAAVARQPMEREGEWRIAGA